LNNIITLTKRYTNIRHWGKYFKIYLRPFWSTFKC